MPTVPRIRVETFQVVNDLEAKGLTIVRGLQLVRELSGGLGYISPAIGFDENKFPVTQKHRKIRMDWPGDKRKQDNIKVQAFNIHPNAIEHPEAARRYKASMALSEEDAQVALVSIVNYETILSAGQKVANKEGRRVDLFKAGRRAGDPVVDVVYLKPGETGFVVVGNPRGGFGLSTLDYQPGGPLLEKSFKPIPQEPPSPEQRTTGADPDKPMDDGGSGVREPRHLGPTLGSGPAFAEPDILLITEVISSH